MILYLLAFGSILLNIVLIACLRKKSETYRSKPWNPLATGIYQFVGSTGQLVTIVDKKKFARATMGISSKGYASKNLDANIRKARAIKIKRVQAAFIAARQGKGIFGL